MVTPRQIHSYILNDIVSVDSHPSGFKLFTFVDEQMHCNIYLLQFLEISTLEVNDLKSKNKLLGQHKI